MMAGASAPAKVILFGEHFVVHGLPAILCAIDRRVSVTAETIGSKTILIRSELGNIDVPKAADISDIDARLRPFAYIAKEMIKEAGHDGGISLSISSDIPVGVGLGSSSACCVAASGAVSGLFGRTNKDEITRRALEAERYIFESASGADTAVIASGGIIRYCQGKITQIESGADLRLVIVNSGQTHLTARVVDRVKEFHRRNPDRFDALCQGEARLVDEAERAIRHGDRKTICELMKKNQGYLDEIGVSTPALDRIIDIVNETSDGAKITGAGDGGCIVSLAGDPDQIESLSSADLDCFAAKIDCDGLILFNSL